MMTRMTAITGLALLAACGSASVAERDAAAQTRAASKPLTIAGVRIGMSTSEVQATLAREGWKVETFPGRDWTTTVEEERRRQRHASSFDLPRRGIETIQANKGAETLIVSMRPVATGAAVKHVAYEAPMGGRSAEQLRSQMVQRYGKPDVSAATQVPPDMTWCSGGERCRMAPGAMKQALSVKEDVYHKLQMHLFEGVDTDRAWQADVQRAAAGGTPAKASF